MLELRPSCECCDCPNFGGGFERRPIRPPVLPARDPASAVRVHAPEGCA